MGKENFGSNKQTTAEILREIVGGFFKGEEFYNSLGIVQSVDSLEKICSVQVVNGDIIEDVRLQQIASDEGLFISPKIGSSVIVGWTDNTTAFLSMYSEIDTIIFQGGQFGGLIKIVELTAKINNLVDEVNAIKDAHNSHIHVTTATIGATAVVGLLSATTTQALPASALDKTDFENENFKH